MVKTNKSEPTSKSVSTKNTAKEIVDNDQADKDCRVAHVERVIANRKIKFNDDPDKIADFESDQALKLMQALGTDDMAFFSPFVSQLVNIASQGQEADPASANFVLSVVKGIEPRDQVEAMLAAQMAAIHTATMKTVRAFNHVDTIEQLNIQERTLNKLTRTYVAQMEGLKRYRTGGEQKVTVEHVTVNAGGQAIVGNVDHGGRQKKGNATT